MSPGMIPPSALRGLGRAVLLSAALLGGGARMVAATGGPSSPPGSQWRALAANRVSMVVTNCGSFASAGLFCTDCGLYGGLEYPRGSGKILGFAGGLWFSGRAGDSLRTAVTEYATEFVPGPGVPGGPGVDSLRYGVFAASRTDTAGAAAWMATAVPLGAPVDSAGSAPGLVGDQTLWTVQTDAGVTSQIYHRGPRTPIGLEVQTTAYAFDRAPALQDVVFLHWRIVHRGSETLDSAYVGVWFDADMRSAQTPDAADTSLDLGYAYRTTDDTQYGTAGPAIAAMLLRGPFDAASGHVLRPSAIVGYPNGVDPASGAQYDATLRGLYPWGAAMIDSTTGDTTTYYATGDPVTGTGWLMPAVYDSKFVVAAGPFTFAPGDTQVVDAAIVVGQDADRAGSILAMRANAAEARAAFASGFASVPPPHPPLDIATASIVARPVPARGSVSLDVTVPTGGAQVELDIFDARGRLVRRIERAWCPLGIARLAWDGVRGDGRVAATGVYFARARVGAQVTRARIVLLR
jgi:hypothetical protein